MYSHLLEILRLSRRYALVAGVFAFWGAIAGTLVFVAHWDEATLKILAVVLGGATAFPLWQRFSGKQVKDEEQTIWVSSPKSTRIAPIMATTLLVTWWAAQVPTQSTSLSAESLTTTAQNVR